MNGEPLKYLNMYYNNQTTPLLKLIYLYLYGYLFFRYIGNTNIHIRNMCVPIVKTPSE